MFTNKQYDIHVVQMKLYAYVRPSEINQIPYSTVSYKTKNSQPKREKSGA